MDMPAATASRRHFLYSLSSLTVSAILPEAAKAEAGNLTITAVAFDALAIFDPRPVFRLAEDLFPGHGEELSDVWRTRQFEYTWLRNSMRQYENFWQVTSDALVYAGHKCGLEIDTAQRMRLMSAYLQLKAVPRRKSPYCTIFGVKALASRQEIERWEQVNYLAQLAQHDFEATQADFRAVDAVCEDLGTPLVAGSTVHMSVAGRDELTRALGVMLVSLATLRSDNEKTIEAGGS